VGVPAGLIIANAYSWHVSFYAIAALSAIIVIIVAAITPPLRAHLEHKHDDHPVARTWAVIVHPDHQKAYLFMAALTAAGFLVFSVVPTYLVTNAGVTEGQLPWMYVVGGLCTVFSMNWIGRWTDRSGRFKVFTITTLSCAVPILLVTNLPRVPLAMAIGTFALLMVCMSGRMVPAMAMMTSVVEARYRGGFMSINSAVQQFSMGITSFAAGAIIREGPNGEMTRFSINGILAIVCAYSCIYLAKFLKPATNVQPSAEPVLVEMG
jgi:predicted MFS family arabinose efflux permease